MVRSRSRTPPRSSRRRSRSPRRYSRADRDNWRRRSPRPHSRSRSRSRSRSWSPRGSSSISRIRLCVKGLSPDVDKDTVRYTFAPIAPVDFVDIVRNNDSTIAYLKFASSHGADKAFRASKNMKIGNQTVTVEFATDFHIRCGPSEQQNRFEKVAQRYDSSKSNVDRNAVQEQLDWVTSNAQKGAPTATDFVFDEASGYYYSHQRGMYYDSSRSLYYSTITQQYSRWDSERQVFIAVDSVTAAANVAAKSAAMQLKAQQRSAKAAEAAVEAALKQSNQIVDTSSSSSSANTSTTDMTMNSSSITTGSTSSSSSSSSQRNKANAIKFSFSSKTNTGGKKITKDMQRWKATHAKLDDDEADLAKRVGEAQRKFNAPPRNSGNAPEMLHTDNSIERLPSSSSSSSLRAPMESAPILPPPTTTTTTTSSTPTVSRHGQRARVYVSEEKLACLLCQRQFKDVATLRKHELHSALHKKHMRLDDYDKVQRLQTSAKLLGVPLMPVTTKKCKPKKKRPSAAPAVLALRAAAAPPSTTAAAVVVEPDTLMSDTNVGNRMLQAMGWKKGEGLGKDSSGITAPVTVVSVCAA